MSKQKVFLSGLIIILLIFAAPRTIRYFSYHKAEGTVVKIAQGTFAGFHGATKFNYPIVTFKVDNGEEAIYSKENEILYSVPDIAEKVTVIYNPDDQKEAWLNKFGSFWFAIPDLMIVILCFIAWYGIVNIIFVKPRKKKTVVQKTNP